MLSHCKTGQLVAAILVARALKRTLLTFYVLLVCTLQPFPFRPNANKPNRTEQNKTERNNNGNTASANRCSCTVDERENVREKKRTHTF